MMNPAELLDFLPSLLLGMVVNFQIATISLLIGLMLGGALGWARLSGGVVGAIAWPVVAVMRAAPTFVVMFFLLNAIPRDAQVGWINDLFSTQVPLAPSPMMTVALSLVPFAAAYVVDNGIAAIRHLRNGSTLGALLFLPNLARAFVILVMSSSTGAAIGVTEGISVILREAALAPSLAEKLVIFAIGIATFGIILQVGFAVMRLLERTLGRRTARIG